MNIDLIPNGAIKRVHVSQNDIGRTLNFELFNNSAHYNIPSGAVIKIQGTKPSGLGFSETCTVSNNIVSVTTTEAMTDESGNITTELSVQYNGNVIGSANFVLAVEKNPHPDYTTDGTAPVVLDTLNMYIEAIQTATGLPTGGTKGDILVKKSATDFDVGWMTFQEWEGGSY